MVAVVAIPIVRCFEDVSVREHNENIRGGCQAAGSVRALIIARSTERANAYCSERLRLFALTGRECAMRYYRIRTRSRAASLQASSSVPAAATVIATAAKKQHNQKDDDECGGIHNMTSRAALRVRVQGSS